MIREDRSLSDLQNQFAYHYFTTRLLYTLILEQGAKNRIE